MGFLDSFKSKQLGMKAYRTHVTGLQLRQNGKYAQSQEKLDEAFGMYHKAYAAGFRRSSVLLAYAILTMQNGDFTRARELMLEVERDKTTSAQDRFTLRVNFSICQWKLGQLDKAIETIRQAGHEKMNSLVYQTLGLFLLEKARQTGEFDEALSFNMEALNYDDEDASVLDNLGQLHLLMSAAAKKAGDAEDAAENRKKAAEYLKKAYDSKPDQMTTVYYWAKLLHEDGDDETARKVLDDAKDVTITALCPISRAQLDALRREM